MKFKNSYFIIPLFVIFAMIMTPISADGSESKTGTITINNIDVKYEIRGGSLLDHTYYESNPSISLDILGFEDEPVVDNQDPYYFQIWLPHELINTESNETFKVFLDGQTTAGGQAFQDEDPRWVGVHYDEGYHTIEIIGTKKSSNSITVSTDRYSYIDGDTITISGTIDEPKTGVPVSLRILAPNDDIVMVSQVYPSSLGTYETEFTAGGNLMQEDGRYEISVLYGRQDVTDTTYFEFTNEYEPTKTIEAFVDLEHEGDRFSLEVEFIDVIGQPINHVNYDITATHNSELILQDTGVHDHDGVMNHITAPVDMSKNSRDVINIEIVFQGIGIQKPFGGPIGKVFNFVEYPNQSSNDDTFSDNTPPKILKPTNIVVDAEHDKGVRVNFEVLAIDETDEIVRTSCNPTSGTLFSIGTTKVTCNATDRTGNRAQPVSFSVTVNPLQVTIPNWIKNVASFWCDEKIDDDSFIEGIQYLIDNGIIVVSTGDSLSSDSQKIPHWVKSNACWWSQGEITDNDFTTGIEFLVSSGIIRV